MNTNSPDTEIQALLDAYKATKEAGNYDQLKHFWDLDDPVPFYIAEEIETPLTDWDRLFAYWGKTREDSRWIEVCYDLKEFKLLSETELLAFVNLRWDMSINDLGTAMGGAMGGSNRLLIGARRIESNWKFHTWVEAPLAALVYMQKLYQLNVRPSVLEKHQEPLPMPTGMDSEEQ